MKRTTFLGVSALLLVWTSPALRCAEPNPAPAKETSAPPAKENQVEAELQKVFEKIQAKLQDGKKTEQDLAAEIKEFDALLVKFKDQKTDEVAQILLLKAMLYLQVFDDPKQGLVMIQQLKKDFPETTQGKNADEIIGSIEGLIAAKKVQEGLVVGAAFPEFSEKDLSGKTLSLAQYKGKVVLLDFWATWCGPCIRELPSVLEAYDKFHSQGFEIIGISLDKEEEALTSFLKKQNMSWPQIFDGKGWEAKLAAKYGVTSIPATFLLDQQGKILGKDLRGEALAQAVGKALGKPVPPATETPKAQ